VIQKLCKRLDFRQQVNAPDRLLPPVLFCNAYSDTDCALVASACCYVAAKAEETPLHVKSAVAEARVVFNGESIKSGVKCRDLTSRAATHRLSLRGNGEGWERKARREQARLLLASQSDPRLQRNRWCDSTDMNRRDQSEVEVDR
jgi:hypothetical protein